MAVKIRAPCTATMSNLRRPHQPRTQRQSTIWYPSKKSNRSSQCQRHCLTSSFWWPSRSSTPTCYNSWTSLNWTIKSTMPVAHQSLLKNSLSNIKRRRSRKRSWSSKDLNKTTIWWAPRTVKLLNSESRRRTDNFLKNWEALELTSRITAFFQRSSSLRNSNSYLPS